MTIIPIRIVISIPHDVTFLIMWVCILRICLWNYKFSNNKNIYIIIYKLVVIILNKNI